MEQFKPINEEGGKLEKKVLRIEDIQKGDEFTYKSDIGVITVRAKEILSFDNKITVQQVGGPLNGRIFENVSLTELTRKEEE